MKTQGDNAGDQKPPTAQQCSVAVNPPRRNLGAELKSLPRSALTHLDLFSGIGGFALAAQWAGLQTIAFCEIDPYAQKILIKNFRAVLADSNSGQCRESKGKIQAGRNTTRARLFPDIRELDGTQFRGVFLLTAGVPCQPASVAGQRRGAADNRWLWPETLRILHEAMPTWAIFENPTGILSLNAGMEFEGLLLEMESYSYTVQPIVIPACAVDARHRRDRVWIVAHAHSGGFSGSRICQEQQKRAKIIRPSKTVADSYCQWPDEAKWFAQSGMGRVASRVPKRVDRLKCLGNSIVPAVAFQLIRMILDETL